MTSGDLGLAEGLGQEINEEELDLAELFLYNSPEEDFPVGCDKGAFLQDDNQPPLLMVNHYAYMSGSNPPASSQDLCSYSAATEHLSAAAFSSLGLVSRPRPVHAASPRIEITPSSESLGTHSLEIDPVTKALVAYRDCVSPASSNSSSGWPADVYSPAASPCVSPPNRVGGMGLSDLDLCLAMQDIHTSSAHSSPGASPHNSFTEETFLQPHHRSDTSVPHQRSRSAPPHGKRSHDQSPSCEGGTPVKQRSRSPSPIPLPHEQRGSYNFNQYQAQTLTSSSCMDMLSGYSCNLPNTTSPAMVKQVQRQDRLYVEGYDWATEPPKIDKGGAEVKSESFYVLPNPWSTLHPVHHSAFSGMPLAVYPSLEWSLPSKSGPYELLIQQQPRSHHRAQYETEGSRGAVKTSNGGHPEVQLHGYQGTVPLGLQIFIGTADERVLKPHAFYQVHRVTGKTVATPSFERMINGTKVLEITLEPKKHMRVVIDCVGILKLRNADIELRNGETDIGRKNTRVRLVFRVHIPQLGGQLVSLQVASDPIECSQRSAQELPAVERQDLDQCSVLGGQQMVLTGQNFTSDSKVLFSEKTQDGEQIWEVEATVDRDKSQANMLFLEVPPYRVRAIPQPVKVNFYVVNGKKKRSQPQHFVYTPERAIKSEPLDECPLNIYGCSDAQSLFGLPGTTRYHLEQDSNLKALNVSPSLYRLTTVEPRSHMLTPDLLDNQVCYQSRAGTRINNPVFYQTAGQHYSNCGPALVGASPIASQSASAHCQYVSVGVPVAKQAEGPHEPRLTLRHEGFVQKVSPLGKSPPAGSIHGQADGRDGGRAGGGDQEQQATESVAGKQKGLRYAYLEDVNDIIRRDLRGHNGE